MKKDTNHFAGCLLGGAVGDALGVRIKTLTYDEIIKKYGSKGIKTYELGDNGYAKITDNTQLTLFTAEGLLRARHRSIKRKEQRDLKDTTAVVFRSYLRWLYTQGLGTCNWDSRDYDGWLLGIDDLFSSISTPTTSITTLGTCIMGSTNYRINNSKTCGSVIRVSPVGLFETNDQAFKLGIKIAATTHGNPAAFYSSGAMALLIDNITKGKSVLDSALDVVKELENHTDTRECIDNLEKAIKLSKDNPRSKEAVGEIGKGHDATDALAIALYCALSYPDNIKEAIYLAVNHSGNSGSTGSVTGNIVGANIGRDNIPAKLLENLQLVKEIDIMAKDLETEYEDNKKWSKKYPSW